MIVLDVNLLIYALDEDSPHHEQAREWLTDVLAGHRPVGLAWSVLLAFLRLTTSPIMPTPLEPDTAVAIVDSLLAQPRVRLLTPTPGHWGILRSLINAAGTAGNLTTDAHLAALTIAHAGTLASADHDFRRFPGLDYLNPLAT